MRRMEWAVLFAVLALVVAACGGGAEEPSTTGPPETTTAPAPTEAEHEGGGRTVEAFTGTIAVDGDPSDWADATGLDMTLESIEGVDVESKTASVKVAYDDESVYVLFTVDDDFNWNADEAHLSGSAAVMWAIDVGAGEHMGTEDEAGEGPSLGMVDIWHWELECALGEDQGGAVSDPGEGAPGNDGACNFDDEFATDPEERFDDGDPEGPGGSGAENSLLGVFSHTNPVEDGEGTWTFEMSRPLQTGDSQDAQLSAGGTGMMALAYWDPDISPEGWDDDQHVQSANQGWIEVHFEAE